MSQFAIGSLALELTGGGAAARLGSQIGTSAGISAAITTTILNTVLSAIRRIVDFIKARIRALFALRSRLAQFDPTAAAAQMQARIGDLLRNIARARSLGPRLLEMTRVIERIKNALNPLITFIQGQMITALTTLANKFATVATEPQVKFIVAQTAINLLAVRLQRLQETFALDPTSPGGAVGASLGAMLKVLETIFGKLEDVKKEIANANDMAVGQGANAIFLNDLRLLTEGASLRTFTTDAQGNRISGRTKIGTGGRDLFGGTI